jgi:hypothetical protein
MPTRTVGMNGFDSRVEKKGNTPIQNTRWHARFPKRVSEYAKAYCRSEDTIKAWIKRGKQSGWLPPLEHPGDMIAWYAEQVGPPPDDLVALCGCVPTSAAGAARSSSNGSNGENPPLDLAQAVVEVRKVLADELAALNRANISDARRGILLRNVQRTSDSLCRLETASANIRREDRDVLSWGEFAAAIADAISFLIDTRKSFPHRLMSAIETAYAGRHRRIWRVAQLIRDPLMAAAEDACKDDVRILITAPELHPVIEKIQERFRELEEAALQAYRAGETPIPMTFEPIETANQT